MNLLSQTQNICEELNLDPVKSKGQNFLIEPKVVNDIIKVAELNSSETVLEIGPGLGVLTQELVKSAGQVVAVELDKKLFGYLKSKFQTVDNLKLVEGDILELLNGQIVKLLGNNYKVVANLPYQITSYILRQLLELENKPSELIVMVQKEVAERICAQAGQMSVLAVMVQYYSRPEIVRIVNRDNFWPMPQVDSAVLKLRVRTPQSSPVLLRQSFSSLRQSLSVEDSDAIDTRRQSPLRYAMSFANDYGSATGDSAGGKKFKGEQKIDDKEFFKLVKIGFSSKRKMLKNNLSNIYDSQRVVEALEGLSLNLKVRAQELGVEEWIELYKKMINFK